MVHQARHRTNLCGRILLLLCLVSVCILAGGCSGDGAWSGKAVTWIDVDADGVRDDGEPPLQQVEVVVANYDRETTDYRGMATFNVFLPGALGEVRLTVYPVVPAGYRLTTPPSQTVTTLKQGETVSFGFAYLPGVPTVTPLPPKPTCFAYSLASLTSDVTAIAAGPGGRVWVGTFGDGVFVYEPDNAGNVVMRSVDGALLSHVRSITALPSGVVWFAADGGAMRFDGATWTDYSTLDGLVHSNVYDVAVAPDGVVWFATEGGVSRFDPASGMWTSYTTKNGLADDFARRVVLGQDGSMWFSTHTAVSRLLPSTGDGQPGRWVTYDRVPVPGDPVHLGFENAVAVDPNGSLWFGSYSELIRFDPTNDAWSVFDRHTANGAFSHGVQDLSFAKDGTLWIGADVEPPTIYHYLPPLNGVGPGTWQAYGGRDLLYGADNEHFRAITVAEDGAVWMATDKHVVRCRFEGK